MAVTQYIGARYVPLIEEEWSIRKAYEPLTVVLYQGASYTSRQAVPKGINILDTKFWVCTGNYNAQVEMYRRETARVRTELEAEVQRATEAEQAEVQRATEAEQAEVQRATEAEEAIENVLDYVKADYVKAFDTVAEMKVDETLTAGMVVKTLGFHSVGDGGAGFYTISETGQANEMDIISCGNVIATLVVGECVTPEMLGHSEGTTDATEIISRCLLLSDNIILNGRYVVSDLITITSNKHISGVGSIYKASTNELTGIFTINNSKNVVIENIGFESVNDKPTVTPSGHVSEDNAVSSNIVAIQIINASDLYFNNLKFNSMLYDIDCLNTSEQKNYTFNNFYSIGGSMGIFLQNITSVEINNYYWKCHELVGGGYHAIYACFNVHNINISDCKFYGTSLLGPMINLIDGQLRGDVTARVSNCYCNNTAFVATGFKNNVNISNCSFDALERSGESNIPTFVEIYNPDNVEINVYNSEANMTVNNSTLLVGSAGTGKITLNNCDTNSAKFIATPIDVNLINCKAIVTGSDGIYRNYGQLSDCIIDMCTLVCEGAYPFTNRTTNKELAIKNSEINTGSQVAVFNSGNNGHISMIKNVFNTSAAWAIAKSDAPDIKAIGCYKNFEVIADIV